MVFSFFIFSNNHLFAFRSEVKAIMLVEAEIRVLAVEKSVFPVNPLLSRITAEVVNYKIVEEKISEDYFKGFLEDHLKRNAKELDINIDKKLRLKNEEAVPGRKYRVTIMFTKTHLFHPLGWEDLDNATLKSISSVSK
ncbi:MAG: hypothetical protein HQM10_09050 [Candidatus Riflebacteria bacterium]|nr:hypothetical protein [Candidatus Riflebacteria bacterium]